MRVIAGKARRIPLQTLPGMETRPTTDRIKETLFNMLQPELADSNFLDLFAGSGAIGIEALSRGAGKAVFVEQSPEAVRCIRDNLNRTRLTEDAMVYQTEVLEGIHRAEQAGLIFDLIFMDPPYRMEHEKRVLESLAQSPLVHDDTLIIVEASLETELDYASELGFDIIKVKTYKTNQHIFLMRTV